jgi:hypothetical protein
MRVARITVTILIFSACGRFVTYRFHTLFDIMVVPGSLLVLPWVIRDMWQQFKA